MEKDLSKWKGVEAPQGIVIEGRYVILEPLDIEKHGDELYDLSTDEITAHMKVARGTKEEYFRWLQKKPKDCAQYAVIDKASGKVGGRQYLKPNTEDGVLEISGVVRGPLIARKPASTEAVYLFLRHAFDDLGYRRFEWRCFSINEASRRAAERLGFTLEGILRKHHVVRGMSRDTAVYSIVDDEWPELKGAFEKWLRPENFRDDGRQVKTLGECRSCKDTSSKER